MTQHLRPDAAHPLLTPRLALREFTLDDVDDLLRADGDERVMRYLGAGLAARSRDEVAAGLARLCGRTMRVVAAEHEAA